MADFIRVLATTIADDGLPDIDELQLQRVNLDKVETITLWVSDTRATPTGDDPFLPYLLLVFVGGRELTLPLPPHRNYTTAAAAVDLFCNAVTAPRA